MQSTSLRPQIATLIVDYAREHGLKKGDHLPAQKLATLFRVSRSPVNEALKQLEAEGFVSREPNCGYFLAAEPEQMTAQPPEAVHAEEGEEIYFKIADDLLSNLLESRVSENEIMRRYNISRNEASKTLNRMAREGWIEKLPGNGWEFHPMLASAEAYRMAYTFRIAIEPAAILEETFRIDPVAFKKAREQQQALLDGEYLSLSRSKLYAISAGFHEMIVDCSHNLFFIESLRRVNASRRLMEYRKTINRTRLISQSLEHLHILDLLEDGELQKASDFMRFHLQCALKIKTAGTLE